jgi:hypothetical protein
MKRLLLIAIFTLCLSGVTFAQDPAGPSNVPPTAGGDDSDGVHFGFSISIPDGDVTLGNEPADGSEASGQDTSQEPTDDPDTSSGSDSSDDSPDPWDGLSQLRDTSGLSGGWRDIFCCYF